MKQNQNPLIGEHWQALNLDELDCVGSKSKVHPTSVEGNIVLIYHQAAYDYV